MEMYKLKFTKLQNEIFRLLCVKAGNTLNQREIARLLNVSPTAIAKSLPLLEKEGLIIYQKGKNINLNSIQLNRDSEKAIFYKKTENLKLIHESGIINFLEDKFPGTIILLFGSYSRGEDVTKSDIDIAIIGTKMKETDLTEFEKRLEREINLNFYDSFKDIDKNLKNNMLNGTVLAGGIEL